MHRASDEAAQVGATLEAAVRAGAPMALQGQLCDFPLFPPRPERERWDDLLTRALSEARERVVLGSVTPTIALEDFRRELAGFDFASRRDLGQALAWVIAGLERGVVHLTHPRYFGLFNPAPTFPAECADRIAGAFNPQLATWTTSPVAVEIERHVIASLLRRMRFQEGATGHFTSGGSEANYSAVICALTRAEPSFAGDGARAFAGAPKLYVSRECHVAWFKIAHCAGIGRSAVRLIATDGSGRMDLADLRAAIRADLERRCRPFMVVATAGTTNAGMVDPLGPTAEIAREFGLFYHVDAAWGGAVIASDALLRVLDGLAEADSATIDAHKWFATTMGCGMFFTKHASLLSATFQSSASYMPSNIADLDPYVTTLQWSRRFLGLRLFLSLAVAGWQGFGRHVERCVALAGEIGEQLAARGWSIANRSPLAVLCVEPPQGAADAAAIVKRVLASGEAWISLASFEGRKVIRICVTHGETAESDVARLVDILSRSA
jgi:glutamate/tyrosine decarboxylase-like PLP-dependent enzyme